MKKIQHALLICLSLLCLTSMVSADFYYEAELTGQPGVEGPQTTKSYISETGMRVDSGGETTMIINFKKEVFYTANTKTKEYTETKFEELMTPGGADEESIQRMSKMFEQMMESLKVQKTEEKQKINDWNCTKYIVEVMGMKSEYWVTQDVKNYKDIAKYTEKYKKVFDKSPLLKQLSTSFEMQKKMDGFPVKTVNEMMGMKIVSTVTKVETKKIDAEIFNAPKDFKKVAEQK